jgi:hypothetical protein
MESHYLTAIELSVRVLRFTRTLDFLADLVSGLKIISCAKYPITSRPY